MENKQNVNIIFSDIINLKILPLINTQLFDLLFQFIALERNHEAHSDLFIVSETAVNSVHALYNHWLD